MRRALSFALAFVAALMESSVAADLGLPMRTAASAQEQARIDLGRRLFMDPRLSADGTVSCGSCHIPEQGFAFNGLPTSIGIGGQRVRRNAPTVLNVAFYRSLFHDGRVSTLEEQLWGPLLAADEMGNVGRDAVAQRVADLPDYNSAFAGAFDDGITVDTIGAALAAYQRSLVSGDSRFDRWYYGNETQALSAQEKRGFVVFRGKAQCNACHTLGPRHALFTDDEFHNLGVGYLGRGVALRENPVPDPGRFEVTLRERDRSAFRTPTLRNVELTAPYMHDGSMKTLREVVDFYDRAGNPNANLDPLMVPLYLSEREKEDLVAFMRALTGANVEELAHQARAAAPK